MKRTKGERRVKVKIPRVNPWAISTLILLIILAIFLVVGPEITGRVTGVDGKITAQEAADNTIDYINEYVLQGQGTATLTSVEEENGFYHIKLNIGDRIYDSYVTLDGKWLFPTDIIDLTETPEIPEIPKQEIPEVPKSDKLEAHVFIMSYCPYGVQFLKAYIPVMELLGDKADLEVNFVDYIMHGEKEIHENNRMHCIQREQRGKLTEYLSCFVEKDDWEECYNEVGIDKSKIDSCIEEIDEEFKITELYDDKTTWSMGRYPQYLVDSELVEKFGLRDDNQFGSPTFVLNGKEISVTRTPEGIKQAVCSAFNNPPEGCSQILSSSGNPSTGSC